MIEARITELNYNEILYYLGVGNGRFPKQDEEMVRECMGLVKSCAKPRVVYKRISTKESFEDVCLSGKEIKALLNGCTQTVIFAATIGHEVDKLINLMQVKDMSKAVILDACASCCIENVCDNFEKDMRDTVQQEGLYLTERYSPGYGDLPIDVQKNIGEYLNTQRRIGVIVSDRCMMTPVKSVTAIMGIGPHGKKCIIHRCESCSSQDNCLLRKAREGKDE